LKIDANADVNGRYEIHSLYFDDIHDNCMRDNDQGAYIRFKYRIRYYGDKPNLIRLERKEKWLERCHKDSCILDFNQFQKIMNNDINDVLWNTENNVLKKFLFYCLTKGFTPKAIIDYERAAYVEPISNVRITIDSNISASNCIEDFLIGNYTKIPVQDIKLHVLEVKFDYILPSYIRHILNIENLVKTSFSKYYLGREQLKMKGY
jgi:hypothetical protein